MLETRNRCRKTAKPFLKHQEERAGDTVKDMATDTFITPLPNLGKVDYRVHLTSISTSAQIQPPSLPLGLLPAILSMPGHGDSDMNEIWFLPLHGLHPKSTVLSSVHYPGTGDKLSPLHWGAIMEETHGQMWHSLGYWHTLSSSFP